MKSIPLMGDVPASHVWFTAGQRRRGPGTWKCSSWWQPHGSCGVLSGWCTSGSWLSKASEHIKGLKEIQDDTRIYQEYARIYYDVVICNTATRITARQLLKMAQGPQSEGFCRWLLRPATCWLGFCIQNTLNTQKWLCEKNTNPTYQRMLVPLNYQYNKNTPIAYSCLSPTYDLSSAASVEWHVTIINHPQLMIDRLMFWHVLVIWPHPPIL